VELYIIYNFIRVVHTIQKLTKRSQDLYTCMLQLEIMDLEVSRNFFGRQVNSFEAQVKICDPAMRASCNKDTFPGVFIRAPAIVKSLSPDVEILGTTAAANGHDVIVAAKQGNVMTTAFHPELTDDFAWHLYFLKMIMKKKSISV